MSGSPSFENKRLRAGDRPVPGNGQLRQVSRAPGLGFFIEEAWIFDNEIEWVTHRKAADPPRGASLAYVSVCVNYKAEHVQCDAIRRMQVFNH